jgi:hypothetical protein
MPAAGYVFSRQADRSMPVGKWRTERFHTVYPELDCRVLLGDEEAWRITEEPRVIAACEAMMFA